MASETLATGAFSGSLDGAPSRSISVEVARAGTKPYLLIGLNDGFILDIEDIDPARSQRSITLIDPEDRRFTAQHEASIAQQGARCSLQLTGITLSDASGRTHTLDGTATWSPPESPASLRGELRLRSGDRMLPTTQPTLRRSDAGWMLLSAVPLRRGHTITIRLTTDPPHLQLTEARLVSGASRIRSLDHRDLTVRVVARPEAGPLEVVVVRFTADVDDTLTGYVPLIGEFTATAAASKDSSN